MVFIKGCHGNTLVKASTPTKAEYKYYGTSDVNSSK